MPDPPNMVICPSCRYWLKHRDDDAGDCVRHSPVLLHPDGGRLSGAWPETWPEDTCGDSERRAELDDAGLVALAKVKLRMRPRVKGEEGKDHDG